MIIHCYDIYLLMVCSNDFIVDVMIITFLNYVIITNGLRATFNVDSRMVRFSAPHYAT
jgi:hypothetical protein